MSETAKYNGEFDRRVYQREFEHVLGCGSTWFRELQKRGMVRPGRRDPGGKRNWWYASEVARTLETIGAGAKARPITRTAANGRELIA